MIDQNRIDELRSEMGAEGLSEMIVLFAEETEAALTRMQARGTGGASAEELHFIRGMALKVGAIVLAALCQDAESQLASGAPHPDPAPLRGAFDRARAELANLSS